MASRRTCATLTKGLLRVRLSERSRICREAHTVCRTFGSPLNAINWVPQSLQSVRFYARLRAVPSAQPPQSAPAPSYSHAKNPDDDGNKQQEKDEEEDNDAFLFGKYDNDYSDDDTEDFFIPDITTDYDDD